MFMLIIQFYNTCKFFTNPRRVSQVTEMWLNNSRWGVWEVHLQDAECPEAPERPLGDVADGVVAEAEGVEIPQHGQAALLHTSQVVVRQIPGERRK